ncbi:MAG: TetR/AcrR family transcriptional regulator [Pseudomonadota bacterium]
MSSENLNTRERILRATWEMLDSNPGVAARMSDIAKKANVSRQALYLHFPNRTELFIATTKYQDEVFNVDNMLATSRAASSGQQRLDAFVEAWGSYIPKIYGVAKTLMLMQATDVEAAAAWDTRMRDMREGCEAAVFALSRDGQLSNTYTEKQATDVLWSLLSISTWETLTIASHWSQDAYLARIKQITKTLLVAQSE